LLKNLKKFISVKFCLGMVAILLIKTIVIDFHPIPSESMEPGVEVNDVVIDFRLAYGLRIPFVSKYVYRWSEPSRGDVVHFYSPINKWHESTIKRVIGVPGDTVQFVDKELLLNGEKIECVHSQTGKYFYICNEKLERIAGGYEVKKSKTPYVYGDFTEEFIVPPGKVFLAGDNRNNSSDSRKWGMLPFDRVYGQHIYTFKDAKWIIDSLLIMLGLWILLDFIRKPVSKRKEKAE